MTDDVKRFFEFMSEQDEEVRAKASALEMADLIAFAANAGFELTEADFAEPDDDEGEVSLDEADAVAGGGTCACVVGGGGTSGYNDRTCACVVGGWGETSYYGQRCTCPIGGYGSSRDE